MTPEDLQRHFGGSIFNFASELVEDGLASVSGRSLDGEHLFGVVREGRACRLFAPVPRPEEHQVQGECSCGQAPRCVHLCALLLAYLQETAAPATEAKAGVLQPAHQDEPRQLIYWLNPHERQCAVQAQLVLLGSQGQWLRRFVYRHQANQRPPRYLREEDLQLLHRLERQRFQVHSQDGDLVRALLASGRCYHQPGDILLWLAEPRPIALSWRTDEMGNQQPDWRCAGEAHLMLFPEPWYLDSATGATGPAIAGLPRACLEFLGEQRQISPDEAAGIGQQLLALAAGHPLPLPRVYPIERRPPSEPEPVIQVGHGSESGQVLCQLMFRYQGLPFSDPASNRCFLEDRIIEQQRDRPAETRARQRLARIAPRRAESSDQFIFDPLSWHGGGGAAIALLRGDGWLIQYAEGFSERIQVADTWYGLVEGGANDWFQLSIGIRVDGEEINLVPLLRELIRQGDRLKGLPSPESGERFINVPYQGRYLALPEARVRLLLSTLLELYAKQPGHDGTIRISALHAAARRLELDQGLGQPMSWSEPSQIGLLREGLQRGAHPEPMEPPQGLGVTLRDYQRQGLSWLRFIGDHGVGGILADDMGLGKTLQTLSWLLGEQERGNAPWPSLVVAPTSLLGNWRAEAARFTPGLRVLVLHGPQRATRFAEIPDHDLIVTSYPLLVRDLESLSGYRFNALILDEAQAIKNPASKASAAVRALSFETGLCLTGTPMENHLGEFWALFDFLMPGFLGGPNLFQRLVRTPIEKEGDADTAQRLAQRIRPFLLRRTKQEVLTELPPKTEIERYIVLEGAQRDLYETVRGAVHEQVRQELHDRGLAQSSILILDALLKLRQVCCDPRLVKLRQAQGVTDSAKLDYVKLLLPEMIEEGRRILLFSQFTSMLELIEGELRQLGLDYAKLTGQTRDRAAEIQRFQGGAVPLFLISLKAGGVGLNLTAADTVIHYDPWWNPAVERQASDRAHRLGQDKPVFVYKLLCDGTVETRIRDLQARKQALADNLLEHPGAARAGWDERDLEVLFAPLEEM